MPELWSDHIEVPKGFAERTPWVDVSAADTVTFKVYYPTHDMVDIYVVWSDDPLADVPELHNIFDNWDSAPGNEPGQWVPDTPRLGTYAAIYTANPLYPGQEQHWKDSRIVASIEIPDPPPVP